MLLVSSYLGTKLLHTGRLLKILNSAGFSKDSPQLMDIIGSNKKKLVEVE